MDANGIPNQDSRARAELAAIIAKEQSIECIITSGWAYRNDCKMTLADCMKEYLVHCGLAASKIITENNSRDTVGDAYFTRINIAKPMSFSNLCVVTSDYHLDRAKLIFDFVYAENYQIDLIAAKGQGDALTITNEERSKEAFKQTFSGIQRGNMLAIAERMRTQHPLYNGLSPLIFSF